MRVIVDNSAGGDGRFADEVAAGLRDRGIEVELRKPAESAMFDTGVHLITAGIVIRVPATPGPEERAAIESVVRDALSHRSSPRRRMRAVPIYLGETARALAWIDPLE